jgi:hypothetical protein
MSKVYNAMMRAQQPGDGFEKVPTLRERLRRWISRSLAPTKALPPAIGSPPLEPPIEMRETLSRDLEERFASLQLSVDALDDRLSAEVVEREAKLLEEIRSGMRGLETELSDRFVAAVLEMKRTMRRGVALLVGFVAVLAGFVVGALSMF